VVNLQSYLDLLTYNPHNITSLRALREFTRTFPREGYPTRDIGGWAKALQNWNNTDPRFWPAYQKNVYFGNDGGLLGALKRHNLDAILMPATFASHWAAGVGSPIVTVPLGFYPAGTPITKNSWGLVQSAPNIPYA
jgi:amidase